MNEPKFSSSQSVQLNGRPEPGRVGAIHRTRVRTPPSGAASFLVTISAPSLSLAGPSPTTRPLLVTKRFPSIAHDQVIATSVHETISSLLS